MKININKFSIDKGDNNNLRKIITNLAHEKNELIEKLDNIKKDSSIGIISQTKNIISLEKSMKEENLMLKDDNEN